jgi:hypothetical protein
MAPSLGADGGFDNALIGDYIVHLNEQWRRFC